MVTDLAKTLAELGIPETLDAEQPWMQALRLVLPRVLPVKLFRQVPGRHKVERGGVMQGAPVGAADLTGYVVGPATRLEIEAKYGAGKLRPEQRRWLDVCAGDGCVALVLAYDPAVKVFVNLHVAIEALRASIVGRGVVA